MKRMMKVALLAVILIAACLCPLQHSTMEQGNTAQFTWANNNYSAGDIEPYTFKNSHLSFQTIPVILFIMFLLTLVPPHARLKYHIRSFIPTLRLLYILNPVKYKTKFIRMIPVLL